MSIERYDYQDYMRKRAEATRLYESALRRRGSKSWTPRIIAESTPGGDTTLYDALTDDDRHIMPVCTKMPLVRFAAGVEAHTAKHGEPPTLIWPTDAEAVRLSRRLKR